MIKIKVIEFAATISLIVMEGIRALCGSNNGAADKSLSNEICFSVRSTRSDSENLHPRLVATMIVDRNNPSG